MGSYWSKAREGRFRAARSDDSKKALRWFRVCFYCFWVFFGGLFFFFLFIFESFFCGQKLYQSRLQHARRPFRHVETREWTWKGFEGAWMERGMSLDHEIWFWATVSIFFVVGVLLLPPTLVVGWGARKRGGVDEMNKKTIKNDSMEFLGRLNVVIVKTCVVSMDS